MLVKGVFQFTHYDLELVNQAIQYLEKHYRNNISPDQLAIEVGLEIKKLGAGFKKQTKLTIHKYLIKIRIGKATEDLHDRKFSIKQIADRNGFKDVSQFGKLFKKHHAKTPLEYRQDLLVYG